MNDPYANIQRYSGSGVKSSIPKRKSGMNAIEAMAVRDILKQEAEARAAKRQIESGQRGVGTALQQSAGKDLAEKYGLAGRTLVALRNLYGYGKNVEEEFKNPITGKKGAGAVAGIMGKLGGSKFAPGPLQESTRPLQRYISQEEEVKMSMVPILSGQARYVVDLANAIQKTIPGVERTFGSKTDLTAQSARNILGLTFAVENGHINNDLLKSFGIDPNEPFIPGDSRADALLQAVQLSPEQQADIEEGIKYVLDAPELGGASQVINRSPIPGSPGNLEDEIFNRLKNK